MDLTNDEVMSLDRLHLKLQEELGSTANAVTAAYIDPSYLSSATITRMECKRDELMRQSVALGKVLDQASRRCA